ncbi:PorP/SprF family type IX secretion system membrane protein [Flavobacterium sp. 3-210]
MKTNFLMGISLLSVFFCHAQQDSQFTQYMYNTININPAYAGSRGVLSVFGLHRSQWIGLDGAPTTNAVSVNTPINGSKVGLGLSLVNDKIGPTSESRLSSDFSYTIPTSDSWKLSFGLKATVDVFNLDINKLSPERAGDPQFQNFKNDFSPNIGAGIYWHSGKAYMGISVPGFIQTKHYNDNNVAIYKDLISYYLIGGYVFDISQDIKFKPAILSKIVKGAPLQIDASANFLVFEKLSLGVAYRWDAAVSALAGFQVSDGLYIGYGYDAETTKLKKYNSGSHEIFLRFELFKKYDGITTGRFF